jgi:hypothetical protein
MATERQTLGGASKGASVAVNYYASRCKSKRFAMMNEYALKLNLHSDTVFLV